jgi:hypothetical protein
MTEKEVARANKRLPEIMGAKEVAAELGIEVSNLERQSRLPAAAADLACGRIWRADVIRKFAIERRERRGV